jgi:hypothetical protein
LSPVQFVLSFKPPQLLPMKSFMLMALIVAALVATAAADCYMQNPRGCNDRLSEANTNRNNDNRLFDSQNNAKGGYCWGPPLTFIEGSMLSIEWTTQHSCNNPKVLCNMVLQFMCSAADAAPYYRVRDGSGSTTNTITESPTGALETDTTVAFPDDPNRNLKYGQHENYDNWLSCITTQRNMGLFIADRAEQGGLNTGRTSARFSRQNNNGDRYGFECTEERDYYPYWRPSPWMDIAVLTDNTDYCSTYRSQSENVQGRYVCQGTLNPPVDQNQNVAPITQAGCINRGGQWTQMPANGMSTPDCVQVPWSRDNHLGNGRDGFNVRYNWTLPQGSSAPQLACVDSNNCQCVLRLRYNISQSDVGTNNPAIGSGFLDWTYNANPQTGFYPASLTYMPPTDNQIFTVDGLKHQLALDTTQYGRTFQDRSFVFHISKRDSSIQSFARIHNLNVRGKRGNIVETYPATEYDFTPTYLGVRKNDYVHFQWTGCFTNPAGNAGEGTDQRDQSNIVQLQDFSASRPAPDGWLTSSNTLFDDQWMRMHMAYLEQPYWEADDPTIPIQEVAGSTITNTGPLAGTKRCMNYADLLSVNNNNENSAHQDVRNCMKLNAAAQYFNGGLVTMNKTGSFYYMSSRNNNFSNRSQKAVIYVADLLPPWAIALIAVGGVMFVSSMAVAGAMIYSKSHPHSRVAHLLSKM